MEKAPTITDVEKAVNDVYLLKDKGIVRVLLAATISNLIGISDKPVWLMIIAGSSSGKCNSKDTPIVMFDGSIKMVQDIKVGDLLMGDDSTPRKVLSTCSGTDMLYKIKQEKGDDYVVNSPHVLTLKYNSTERKYKGIDRGHVIDIPLNEYLKKSATFKRKFSGYKVGVEFDKKPIDLDPYYLGIWLGDGATSDSAISKPDIEIENFLSNYAKELGMGFSIYRKEEKCSTYRITRNLGDGKNKLSVLLDKHGLLNNKNKFIPFCYKTNTRAIRLQVLAGLLDTDGFLNHAKNIGGQHFEFVNKSKQLAEDVVFLARSLGFHASINKTIKGIKSTGFTGTYWRVYIGGEIHKIPTKIPRKQAKLHAFKRDPLSTGIEVKKLKRGKYYGFELDGNGRFLLGDFTVTHNTALLQTLDGLDEFIMPIDTLTANTFASALKTNDEPSLLHKANGKVLVFKDFSTLTSMNKDALQEIMGQFRAIYDGSFVRHTGNNATIDWAGKIGVLAAGTTEVQRMMRYYSGKGERFINYLFEQPDAVEMTRRAITNQQGIREKEAMLRDITAEFVRHVLKTSSKEQLAISPELQEDMIELANFTTLARSPVTLDFRTGKILFVPDREMPSRVATMLTNLASTLMIMNGTNTLTEVDHLVISKCGFDSIPPERRMILRALTKHSLATTKTLAIHLNYETPIVGGWCAELNALKLVDRVAKAVGNADGWKLKLEYRKLIAKYENIKITDDPLIVSAEQERVQESLSLETDRMLLNKMYDKETVVEKDDTDWEPFEDEPIT